MSAVHLTCPCCDAEFDVEVSLVSEGYPGSRDYPSEGPEWDVEGPSVCAECGEELAVRKLIDEAIERATQSHADDRASGPCRCGDICRC